MSTTADIPTEQLISQLALSATWLHLDGARPGPIDAALEVLEVRPDDAVLAEVAGAVAAAEGLDWTEQVAYALHLILTLGDDVAPSLLAA